MNRTFAIGDIHGCNRTLRQLLFGVIKLRKEDTLYLLGDYIDRGRDSKGVIDTILELQNDGYDVRPILGNHEDMLLKAIYFRSFNDWLDNGGRETMKSYAIEYPENICGEHLDFLWKLPYYRVTGTRVYVHAGLDFSLADPLRESSHDYMLWERVVNAQSARIAGRKLVTGHTVADLDEIKESIHSNHIRLDNGCCYGDIFPGMGNLVALEVNSGELLVQKFLG